MTPYKAPEYDSTSFNCPACDAFAEQSWVNLVYVRSNGLYVPLEEWEMAVCAHCGEVSIWKVEQGTMVYPDLKSVQSPNLDLQEDIKYDYLEAASILQKSPRGAVALLRLCIQKLCQQLGEKGENINNDIKSLVAKGLRPQIQKALDIVRVVGNNAVHPGQLDLKDDVVTANKLFALINLIAQTMITEPKEIEAMFNGLPQSQLDAIAKRDGTP